MAWKSLLGQQGKLGSNLDFQKLGIGQQLSGKNHVAVSSVGGVSKDSGIGNGDGNNFFELDDSLKILKPEGRKEGTIDGNFSLVKHMLIIANYF